MPDVTYYVRANAGAPPLAVATPGQCYFQVAFDGSGDGLRIVGSYEDTSCTFGVHEDGNLRYTTRHDKR